MRAEQVVDPGKMRIHLYEQAAVLNRDIWDGIVSRLEEGPAHQCGIEFGCEKPWERCRGGPRGGSWRGSLCKRDGCWWIRGGRRGSLHQSRRCCGLTGSNEQKKADEEFFHGAY